MPDLGSGGQCLQRQPILAADDQAGAVVLAPLVTVDVRVDVLRLVEGPANTSAVILQEMTVPHHLELARSDAAGASLGPIGQQKGQLRLLVTNDDACGDRGEVAESATKPSSVTCKSEVMR